MPNFLGNREAPKCRKADRGSFCLCQTGKTAPKLPSPVIHRTSALTVSAQLALSVRAASTLTLVPGPVTSNNKQKMQKCIHLLRSALLCYRLDDSGLFLTMLCYLVLLHSALFSSPLLYFAILYHTIPYSAVRCYANWTLK